MALIEAYRRRGAECCSELKGAFALALLTQSGDALLAVDRMAVHNLVYTVAEGELIFASTAAAIRAHPQCRRNVDWQSIYNYVYFHMVPGPATAYRDERRLLPGQSLHWRNGAVRLERYWQPRFVEDERHPFEESREEFLSKLSGAVGRMSEGTRTGSFLSGGTDSSTISGLLGRASNAPAETFSIGFAEAGYDEMSFARIAARHFGSAHHEYYVTPNDILDAIPRLASIFDQPFGNSSAVPTFCCARLARESGMDLLLGGDGGDELFGGNERYATQYLYSLYGRLPPAFRSHLIEPLARHLPGARTLPPIRWYRRLVEIASTPLPQRMEVHNLLLRLGAEEIFVPELLSKVDRNGPLTLMQSVYAESNGASLINRMLAYDFRFTLADSDLPKVVKSCELAGLRVDFPMLDDDVVHFSMHLAPELKLKGTKLRYFFKQALQDFLPREIITKTKHGFGLPFGPWMQSHPPLGDFVRSTLSSLRKRGFVRPAFIDQLVQVHLQQHPAYYGTMAWVLMMLEQWFQAQQEAMAPLREERSA